MILEEKTKSQLEGKLVKAQQVISMSLKERDQSKIFEQLKNGVIMQQQAADALGLSLRQVQRKIKNFLLCGDASLVHGNRGRLSNRRIKEELVKAAINLVEEKYADFGPTLASEMLEERDNIKINHETLRLLMIRKGIWHRKVRKIKSKRWRKRKMCFGSLIQLDGSTHDWFEGRRGKCTLLVFIDDATSEVVWLEFVESESLEGVMRATKNYLIAHGRPVCFYTDYGSVFSVNTNNPEHIKKTQYERALKELGIKIIHAKSAQAKGRVERSNSTHQDRLVKMLRLENISTIEEANAYLHNVYIPKHNRKFAVEAESTVNMHQSIDQYDLDNILCVKEERVLTNDRTIMYKSQYLQLSSDQKAVVFPKEKIMVHEHLSGVIKLFIRGIELTFIILPKRPQKQHSERKVKEPKVTKPGMNHPWKNPGIRTQPGHSAR